MKKLVIFIAVIFIGSLFADMVDARGGGGRGGGRGGGGKSSGRSYSSKSSYKSSYKPSYKSKATRTTRTAYRTKSTSFSGTRPRGSTVATKGYQKKDGTYVEPYNRTAPNETKNDNWSTKGNVNPYTGKEGTKDPLKQ